MCVQDENRTERAQIVNQIESSVVRGCFYISLILTHAFKMRSCA